MDKRIKIGILGSTNGTSLQSIIDAIEKKELTAEIVTVISNKKDSGILKRALNHNINTNYVNSKNKNRQEYDSEITSILQAHNVELVLMIGYMRIVSKEFCETWNNQCMNVHPSLLPEFAKGMDLEVHKSVIESGKSYSGCTIHFVTEDVDGGPIVYQERCEVKEDDTPETLKSRVQNLEGLSFIYAIKKFQNGMTYEK